MTAMGDILLSGALRHIRWLVRLLFILIILIVLSIVSRERLSAHQLLHVIDDLGMLAPVGFIPLAAFLVIIFMPPILSIVVGWLAFGAILGASYSIVGMTVGSCMAFIAGRYFIGEVDITLAEGRTARTLQKVNEIIKHRGFLTVLGLKLLFFSNSALDYGVSRTEVRFKDYLLGTFSGIIPRTFVLAYLFEAVLRPAMVAAEGMAVDTPIESLIYDSLLGRKLIEHALGWLVMLLLTRVCGMLILGILARWGQQPSVERS
jgi:uncharacterized membrane protein YdjX (TVP38/TMEM64 family)